jgi:DNA cross-link repair 1A protein
MFRYIGGNYTFPTQDTVIKSICDFCSEEIRKNPKTLFLCGTYTIGKEKVWKALAEKLDRKVWAPTFERKIIECLTDRDLLSLLGTKESECQIHVVSMKLVNSQVRFIVFFTLYSQ